MIKTKSTPKMTGTYDVCPIPFKLDTYSGCTFGCKYCFARDIVQFARSTHNNQNLTDKENTFYYLKCLDIEYLKKWINSAISKDSTNIEKIMFKNRIPIKIGVMADPFPYIEEKEKITYNTLKLLDELDYPIQLSTKKSYYFSKPY